MASDERREDLVRDEQRVQGTPHDALVRSVFDDPAQALVVLRLIQPELAARIVPGSLALIPGSFLNQALRGTVTDLLYSARIGDEEVLVYVLVEHQSTVQRWMVLRAGRLVHRIWARWRRDRRGAGRGEGRRQGPLLLPLVIPVVLYQGQRWSAPTRLRQLVAIPREAPELARYLHDLELDVHALGDDAAENIMRLAGRALARLVLLVLRATALSLDVVEVLLAAGELVPRAFGEDEEGFSKVAQYVEMTCGEDVRRRAEAEMIRKHGPSFKGFWSPKELREEGRVEGREEGRVEGREEALRANLMQLLRIQHEALPPDVITRIETGTPDSLSTWFERAARGLPLAQVFGG